MAATHGAPRVDEILDARGLLCPLPVLRARKRLLGMPPGSVLAVLASDPAAIIDMPHFCAQAEHELLSVDDAEGGQKYLIRRGIKALSDD